MRASRLLSIVLLLQNRGRMTGPELASELEVSVRTVYRDIDALSAAGIPVVSDRGSVGGFRLLDGYRTRLTGLTPNEADALLFGALGGIAADLGIGQDRATAEGKLLAALPDGLRDRASLAHDRFLLDVPGWFTAEESSTFLPLVASAVWESRRLTWRYQSWRGVTDRTVDPLALVLKGGAWYVIAGSDGKLRTYRVNRIQEATLLDEPVSRPDGFNLAAYWAEWSTDFNRRLYPDSATIRLSPRGMSLLPHFLDSYRTEALRRTASAPGADGWVTAEVPIEQVGHAALEILHFGVDLIVESPPELRAEVAALAADVARRYRDGESD
ncbi:MAG TPA: YafY family protein [Thermomicrobiales bacterium]|jgi:predicted DNA-binding transcriptional regulator YafY|nr:YafY family protein [Thermomicrobiales bacterium]